jgi:RNA polymerase sigma factor (sigma-70 family)
VRLLIEPEHCTLIIEKYYREIFSYCYAKLGYSHHSAEDCTQEVFVVFFTKHERLDETDNIRLWLYRTADNVIKAFMRKSPPPAVSIEDSPEAMDIADSGGFAEDTDSPLDILDEEERQLLELYYDSDYGQRTAAAKKLGITLPALYRKVHKIKKKLRGVK